MASMAYVGITPSTDRTGNWAASGMASRTVFVVFSAVFASLSAFMLVGYVEHPHPANDFFAFDSFSRFVRWHRPVLIYDQRLLEQFQNLPGHKLFAFMYHPGMLLLLWPLAYLPYVAGYVAWVSVGMAACCVAVSGSGRGWPLALLVVVAPSTLWTILCGQSSLLVAALLVGGLRLAPHRPILAGMLIGLATYKPQLGLLVPVALVAAGQWRSILSAAATTLCIVGLSTAAFGIEIWPGWVRHLPSIMAVRSGHMADWAPLLATVSANLSCLGLDRHAADATQTVSLLGCVALTWWCFRPGTAARADRHLLSVSVLGIATFLATPFAFIYDLPLFTAAMLLFVEERRRSNGAFAFGEVMVVIVALLLPWLLLIRTFQGCSSLFVLLALSTVLRRVRRLDGAEPPGRRMTVDYCAPSPTTLDVRHPHYRFLNFGDASGSSRLPPSRINR